MNNCSINILIADDDSEDVLLLKEALEDNLPSCKCVHATDGIAALRHIKTDISPDLVFLDVNMPLKNGINCLKDIANQDLLPATPIIVFSSSKNIRDIRTADEYGAAFYIVKPTSFDEWNKLIFRAIELLGKPKSEKANKSNFVLREGDSFDIYNN